MPSRQPSRNQPSSTEWTNDLLQEVCLDLAYLEIGDGGHWNAVLLVGTIHATSAPSLRSKPGPSRPTGGVVRRILDASAPPDSQTGG